MKRKSAFTLVEMLIVVSIIGIITSMTFNFGTDRIRELDRQSVRDQFVDAFTAFVGQARISSYLNGQNYNQMNIYFSSGAQGFDVGLSGDNSQMVPGFTLSTVHIDRIGIPSSRDMSLSSVTVLVKPYAVGCQIFASDKQYSGLIIESTIVEKKDCFSLDPTVCSLKKIACN